MLPEKLCSDLGVLLPKYDFAGKTAIVTGASSGIGLALATQLTAYGANVVIASLPAEDCDRAAEALTAAGGSALSVPTDVSDARQIDKLIARTVEAFGGVDIMVNNAGVGGQVLPLLEQDEEEFDKVLRVNLKGVFLGAKAAAKQMIAQGRGGRIINTCSIAYIEGGGMHGPYGAAKGGVSTITRTMASEWAQYGITVNAVAPGLTRTPINETLSKDPVVYPQLIQKIPMRRMAEPGEIAAMMLFLASDAASFVTGTTVVVDGGATVGGQ